MPENLHLISSLNNTNGVGIGRLRKYRERCFHVGYCFGKTEQIILRGRKLLLLLAPLFHVY